MNADSPLQYLIFDTNAIILGDQFWKKAPNLLTTEDVLDEVKDRKSVTWLNALPVAFETKNPDRESILHVMAAARELGDFGFLSKTDIKVLALAYQYSRTYDPDFKDYQPKEEDEPKEKDPGFDDRRIVKDTFIPGVKPVATPVPGWGTGGAWAKPAESGMSFADMLRKKNEEEKKAAASNSSTPSAEQTEKVPADSSSKPVETAEEEVVKEEVAVAPKASVDDITPPQMSMDKISFPTLAQSSAASEVVPPDVGALDINDDDADVLKEVDAADALAAAEAEAEDEEDEEEEDEEESEDDWGGSDGEGEWITPSNVNEVNTRDMGLVAPDRPVALFTTDFPMQNVAMHLGLYLLATDGRAIRQLKKWILRCHGCYTLVVDTTRQFCPQCGSGDTLKKVSYTVDDKGEYQVWINPKKEISIKHTKMNLHKPKGGRSGTNRTLVLREDQMRYCGRLYSREKDDKKLAALWDEEWQFAPKMGSTKKVTHRAGQESFFATHKRGPIHRKKG